MIFSWEIFKIKMTSRKLWISIGGLATSIMAYLNCDSNTIVQVTAIISALGTVVGYLIANGLTDDSTDGADDTSGSTDTASTEETAAGT